MASPPNRSGRAGFGANGNANDKGAGSIDREAKCPLLLRVFCASSRHNSLSDYNKGKNIVRESIMKINQKFNATIIVTSSIAKPYPQAYPSLSTSPWYWQL